MRIALYPGTFDPITYGHIDIIDRSVKLFDEVIVTVAIHPEKATLFTLKERVDLIGQCVKNHSSVRVLTTRGLIVDFAREAGACALIRGLRFVSDFELEFQMAWMNRHLHNDLATVFLIPHAKYTHLNSSVVREVARLGGNVDAFVPPLVAKKLKEKFSR